MGQTEADLLFRALAAIFLVRSLPSPVRTLAFSKRLLTSSLQWPPASQLRTLAFLRSLLIREPKLEAMMDSSDRAYGRWRGDIDEPENAAPESAAWFEASVFIKMHPDGKIRKEASKLVNWIRD
jgi:nucleolar complex protein 3